MPRAPHPRSGGSRSGATPVRHTADTRGTVTLPRALSKLGICSRAQAEIAIRAGRVRVNGRRVTDPTRRVVPETDSFALDADVVAAPERMYVMLNKPRGTLTTRSDPQGRPTVYGCLDDPRLPFLGPVGRLDQASEGLLLLSNDTQWANAITAPSSHVRKTYHVQIDRVPDAPLITALRGGVTDPDGERLSAVRVEVLRAGERHGWLAIDLDEGRNRQIRRMLEAQECAVLRLVRVAIGTLVLGDLAKGAWRHLTSAEVDGLRPSVAAAPLPRRSGGATRRRAE